MSQQINLLPRGPISPKLSARRALLTLSTFFLMLIAYGQWLHARANAAQQQTLDSEHALQAQRAKLLALQKKWANTMQLAISPPKSQHWSRKHGSPRNYSPV